MKPTTFRLEMNLENEAFSEYHELEIARILHKIADTIENSSCRSFPLFDINGNKVGRAVIE